MEPKETVEQMVDSSEMEKDSIQRKDIRMWSFWMSIGFALTGFVLNVWYVQYILPVIGMGLFCIGVQGMRRVNRFFKAAWIVMLVRMGIQIGFLMTLALPNGAFLEGKGMELVYGFIFVAFYWLIHCAWKDVFDQAQADMKHKPYLLATIWNVLVIILARTPLANTWIAFLAVFAFYIVILRQMECMENDLIEINMAGMKGTYARTGKGRWIVIGYALLCFMVTAVCSVAANQVELNAQIQDEKNQLEIREKLMNMGVSEQAVMELPDEDVVLLRDAVLAESYSEMLMFDPKEVEEERGASYMIVEEPGKHTLHTITTYFEMPDNWMYILVYFEWENDAQYWQDGFTIWGEDKLELIDAALLYEKKGISYEASIPRLTVQSVTNTSWFGTMSTSNQISGCVKYPLGTKKQSGYVFYRAELQKDQWIACNCLNFLHIRNPILLPYQEPEIRILNGAAEYKQQYTSFEMTAYREGAID